MTSSPAIAVLGLGRMGAALAARLVSTGWEVTGWTRSGRAVDSVKPADGPDDAVGPAEFTIGALSKDMALLAGASHRPLGSAAELASCPAGPEADIGLAATTPAAGADVLAPLRAYIRGHATGDPAHFRDAFLPTAHIEGIREGAFTSWSLDEYCALFDGKPAPDEAARSRRVDAVDDHGSVATAAMTLQHGAGTFTDIFLLVHADGRWRIANKAYHRH